MMKLERDMPEIHYASSCRQTEYPDDEDGTSGQVPKLTVLDSSSKTKSHCVPMSTPSSPATAALHDDDVDDHDEHLSMEENHAELLAGYHEVSKVFLERDDDNVPRKARGSEPSSLQDSPPASLCSEKESKLSDTPNTLAGEFQLSLALDAGRPTVGKVNFSRTDSVDRRMNEAAQFCEALGSEIDLQSIIEDDGDSSSDEDNDINEIVLEDTQVKNQNVPFEIHLEDAEVKSQNLLFEREKASSSHSQCPSHQNSEKIEEFISSSALRKATSVTLAHLKKHQYLFHSLPGVVRPHNFEYIGIQSNPPKITEHGITRGNYAQLHRKAWLEVSDKKHRYGKNLRLYYRHWESLGFPTNKFFDWLDSEGLSGGQPIPEIEDCPRSELDSDTVLYINDVNVTNEYALSIEADVLGRILDVDGEPVKTGPEGWIFVLRDSVMYGARKVKSVSGIWKERFHHSSFFGGKAVSAAGIIITDDDGFLTQVFPHSGHYRPGEADMQRMLFYLHNAGVDLRTFEVDTQQLIHASRQEMKNGKITEKKKKIDSLHLKQAVIMAHYLSHKARFIAVFAKIHRLREINAVTVTEALDAISQGGYWKKP
jgi:hypothetical protein